MYSTVKNIEQAINDLQAIHCNLQNLSVLAKVSNTQGQVTACYRHKKEWHYLGRQATFWNKLWKILDASALLCEKDFEPLVIAGQMSKFIVNRTQSVDIDDNFSLLGAALFMIGVPRVHINEYEQAVKDGNFLLLVHGEQQDVEHACDVLHGENQQVTVHRA